MSAFHPFQTLAPSVCFRPIGTPNGKRVVIGRSSAKSPPFIGPGPVVNAILPPVAANWRCAAAREMVMGKFYAVGLVSLFMASAGTAGVSAEEAKIVELQQQQAAAWNAHDIGAYAALFTPGADVINVLGWHWTSRAELQEKLGRGFSFIFANSQLTVQDVSVEFLKPDVAVAHVQWTLTGALSPTGAPSDIPQQGIQTQVVVRQAGVWRVSHFQNTNSVPERPFPLPSNFEFKTAP